MKLYTCYGGRELCEYWEEVFGAWEESDIKHYTFGDDIYSFEIDLSQLVPEEYHEGAYPYYVYGSKNIIFTKVL